MYVPSRIFGHLLTSSNYNDDKQKVTGGRNGYGAKLCNIFSTSFTVETASKEYKQKLLQTWTNNMTCTKEPAIEDSSDDYTKITFSADLKKFKMEKLDENTVDLFCKRAYDVAATTRGVKVTNFKDYVELYMKNHDVNTQKTIVYENLVPQWDIAVVLSDDGFIQVSFVNNISTTKVAGTFLRQNRWSAQKFDSAWPFSLYRADNVPETRGLFYTYIMSWFTIRVYCAALLVSCIILQIHNSIANYELPDLSNFVSDLSQKAVRRPPSTVGLDSYHKKLGALHKNRKDRIRPQIVKPTKPTYMIRPPHPPFTSSAMEVNQPVFYGAVAPVIPPHQYFFNDVYHPRAHPYSASSHLAQPFVAENQYIATL